MSTIGGLLRINFFGGPGSGKSTTTARVFSQLKDKLVSVELVLEYVKAWAHQKRHIQRLDQIYLFGKQHQAEYRYLSAGVKNIVTDSPTWLSVFYATFYGQPGLAHPIAQLCRVYDSQYPSTNIFLHRNDKTYVTEGRYQSADEARALDGEMLKMLKEHYGSVIELDYRDHNGILMAVLDRVDV